MSILKTFFGLTTWTLDFDLYVNFASAEILQARRSFPPLVEMRDCVEKESKSYRFSLSELVSIYILSI